MALHLSMGRNYCACCADIECTLADSGMPKTIAPQEVGSAALNHSTTQVVSEERLSFGGGAVVLSAAIELSVRLGVAEWAVCIRPIKRAHGISPPYKSCCVGNPATRRTDFDSSERWRS